MLLAYIDASGDPGPKGPTSHYVLAAVIVQDKRWSAVFDDVLGFRRLSGFKMAAAPPSRSFRG